MHEKLAAPSASLKPKARQITLTVGGLTIFAALVFGLGINWGLPSHDIDPILFGTGDQSATATLNSYHLTGVGINQLAGSWEDNANLAADVAAHPIADRSKPVTLLENPYVATADDLVAQGDQRLAKLVAAADTADEKYGRARLGSDEKAADAAQDVALRDQQKVQQYVEAFNHEHTGDVKDVIAKDDITRARILRRYRLYTCQPDEMITFRALAMMHPGQMRFDPKLYQYGGLWIYPVGAILKVASLVGFVTATNDTTYYLDSPDAFAKFYILARAYSAAWGIVGMLAVFAIMRRACVGWALSGLTAACFVLMPVVVDLAHEAKPHLAGCSLMLLAILAAQNYVATGKWKWSVWSGIACGAAAGMILWGAISIVVLVVMAVSSPRPRYSGGGLGRGLPAETSADATTQRVSIGKRIAVCLVAILIATLVYFATNPYVAIHLLGDRTVLCSNFGNTEAMYGFRPDLTNATRLAIIGMSWPIAIAGLIGLVLVVAGKTDAVGWLLAIPVILILYEFYNHSGGKPGEYARFAVFADAALMILAFLALTKIHSIPARLAAGAILVIATGIYSFAYERGFLRDSTSDNSRIEAANTIDQKRVKSGDPTALYITAEPAPYCLPPVNLFRWRMILLPTAAQLPSGFPVGVLVRANDSFTIFDPSDTPISWADKRFDVVDIAAK